MSHIYWALVFFPALLWGADVGKTLFEANCLACHQASTALVGPSLYEVNQIYKAKPEGIVSWAIKPVKKRKTGIEMPSMAHVGEENLKLIADYMLKVGAKTRKPKKAKPSFQEDLGVVQRSFMPNSGPASIAVSLPGGHSYCWDAGAGYLRYFWKGSLIPGAHFTSNGKALPTLSSKAYYRADSQPFLIKGGFNFLSYEIDDQGIPEFSYQLGDYEIKERLEYRDDKIFWQYQVKGDKALFYQLPKIKGYTVSVDRGTVVDGKVKLSAIEMKYFSIILSSEAGQ